MKAWLRDALESSYIYLLISGRTVHCTIDLQLPLIQAFVTESIMRYHGASTSASSPGTSPMAST